MDSYLKKIPPKISSFLCLKSSPISNSLLNHVTPTFSKSLMSEVAFGFQYHHARSGVIAFV